MGFGRVVPDIARQIDDKPELQARPSRCAGGPRRGGSPVSDPPRDEDEAVTHLSYPRTAGRPTSSNDQKEPWTVASMRPSLRNEMHELGNLIVAMHFCLRQLCDRQRSHELKRVVRTGLEVSEQIMATFRNVDDAVRAEAQRATISDSKSADKG